MHDPEIHLIRHGGGVLAWIGTPLAVFGVLVVVGSLGAPPAATEAGAVRVPPDVGGIVLGVAFAAVGALLACWRFGVTIDKRGGSVTRWWGLFGPWWSRRRPLAEFDRVTIHSEVRRRGEGTYTVWPVALAGTGVPVLVAASRTYRRARLAGERLARFMARPLEDRGGHDAIVRSPDQLDESVREQARRLGTPVRRPDPPVGSPLGALARLEPDQATLTLPAPGAAVFPWARGLAALGLGALLCWTFAGHWFVEAWAQLWSGEGSALVSALGLCVAAACVLGPPLWVLVPGVATATGVWHLRVSRTALDAEHRGLFRSQQRHMEAGEIEQIAVAPPDRRRRRDVADRRTVVSVRTDAGFVELGETLSDLEQAWLRDVLLHYLAG